MTNRLFANGDIHGCNVALRALIEAIDWKAEDTVVVLGDVIDWGPDSRDCVRQLIDLSGRCQFVMVRGDHEEMLFAALESQSELRDWLNFGGKEPLKSYPIGEGTSSSTGNTSGSSRPKPVTITRPTSSSSSTPATIPQADGRAVRHHPPEGARPPRAHAAPLLGKAGDRRPHPADEPGRRTWASSSSSTRIAAGVIG